MGNSFCACNKDQQNIPLPHTNLNLLDNNNKHNGSNNFNDLNQQSNNNININIININKDHNSKKYSSNYNGSSCINNIETNKVVYPVNQGKNDVVKEESELKEDREEVEEEEEDEEEIREDEEEETIQKIDPKLEELKSNIIKNFDSKIVKFAEYIPDDKFEDGENSIIGKLDENFEKYVFNSKNKYLETFERPGLLFKKDKTKYKGSWNFQGRKEGFGIYYDSNGNKYIGEWKDDKFDGKGRLFSINGDCYDGDFHSGQIEGMGMFISTKGGYNYLGEFKNNKFHGKGKLIYDDNTTYEGNFSDGYMVGEGNLLFRDGSYYKGNFEKNKFEGKGKFYFHDGRKYNGDWKNNNMHGIGIFSWDDDTKYNGEYRNNVREGNGVYSFGANLYDGHWINNMPHGEGTLLNDGLRIVGVFRYGKMVEMTESKGASRDIVQKYTMDKSSRDKPPDTMSEKNEMKNSIFRKMDSSGNSVGGRKSKYHNKKSKSIKNKEQSFHKDKESKKNKHKDKSKEKSK